MQMDSRFRGNDARLQGMTPVFTWRDRIYSLRAIALASRDRVCLLGATYLICAPTFPLVFPAVFPRFIHPSRRLRHSRPSFPRKRESICICIPKVECQIRC